MFNRRKLLAALPFTVLLARCSQPVMASQLASDVSLLAAGLAPLVTAIGGVPNVDPSKLASAQAALSILRSSADQVSSLTANPPPTLIGQVVQAVNAIAQVAGAYAQLSGYAAVVQAALALVPVIQSLAGMQTTGLRPSMSPTEARATLRMAAHQ